MHNRDELSNHSEEIQRSLADAKWASLQEEFNMGLGYHSPHLPPEIENEFLDHILNFEQQFENAKMVSVYERIGRPSFQTLSEVAEKDLGAEIGRLLSLLVDHGIVVDFLGTWTDQSVYAYLVETLFTFEIEDIRIAGMYTHFNPTTPDYDMLLWMGDFLMDLLSEPEVERFSIHRDEPLSGLDGMRIEWDTLRTLAQTVWQGVDYHAIDLNQIDFSITESPQLCGEMTLELAWPDGDQQHRLSSTVHMRPDSPYEEAAWLVTHTSLFDDLRHWLALRTDGD